MSNNDYDTEEFESQQVYGNSAPITAFMNDEIIAVKAFTYFPSNSPPRSRSPTRIESSVPACSSRLP